MYLTKLTLNTRHRDARRDLANTYEMHRTIMRAFPDRAEGGPGRVLFRVEPTRDDEPPVVLVQSEKQPDFDGLPEGYASVQGPKGYNLDLRPGQKLRFRLRANATVKRDGKRLGLMRDEDHRDWLIRKAKPCGFAPIRFHSTRAARVQYRKGTGDQAASQTHQSVDFEGVLQVIDPEKLTAAIAAGIGPAKAFGFGLLSLAPA
ncbi:MAG: type I-E CRISPR-associated protein Cas6/Cse3/CasE [Phycisphaerae bacterium]|nr:type I-E CRISPR-associated protein Cas6/Cse3/CasE [Phycisphaerae bacterium]